MAIVVLWVVLAVMIFQIVRLNDGQYVYPLDDAYIHLAIAKNLSQHGVWGVTQYETSSASSSILWTLVLAGLFKIGGVSDMAPLALNIVFTGVLLFLIDWSLQRDVRLGGRVRCLILIALLPLLALPLLVLNGMEHVLQTIVSLLLVIVCSRMLVADVPPKRSSVLFVSLLGALATMARYEGMFIAAPIVLLSLLRRRWGLATALLIGAALPIVAFGIFSISHEQHFLPNSIVLKSPWANVASIGQAVAVLGDRTMGLATRKPYFFLLVAVLVWGAIRQRRGSPSSIFLTTAAIVVLLHSVLAVVGWGYRYDIYALAIGLIATIMVVYPYRRSLAPGLRAAVQFSLPVGSVVLLVIWLFSYHIAFITKSTASSREIFEQHIQLATFFQRYYPGEVIAANDIGALTFFGDVRLFDVYGLATREVAHERERRDYATDDIERFAAARGVQVAFVYDAWFAVGILPKPAPPASWRSLGQWATKTKFVLGGRVVSFYAVAPGSDERLIANLRDFSDDLPPSVEQGGRYTGTPDLHE